MAKRKSKAIEASPGRQQTLELRGKNVQKDLSVDDEVSILLTAKVTQIGRDCWDDKHLLSQTLLVTDLKKVTKDSIDVDKVFPKNK